MKYPFADVTKRGAKVCHRLLDHLSSRRARGERRLPAKSVAVSAMAAVLLSGCASAPMTRGGSLSSYDSMTPSDGVLAKSLVRVSKDEVLAARTVRIVPTVFSETASPKMSSKQRLLVANAVDRSLCVG